MNKYYFSTLLGLYMLSSFLDTAVSQPLAAATASDTAAVGTCKISTWGESCFVEYTCSGPETIIMNRENSRIDCKERPLATDEDACHKIDLNHIRCVLTKDPAADSCYRYDCTWKKVSGHRINVKVLAPPSNESGEVLVEIQSVLGALEAAISLIFLILLSLTLCCCGGPDLFFMIFIGAWLAGDDDEYGSSRGRC